MKTPSITFTHHHQRIPMQRFSTDIQSRVGYTGFTASNGAGGIHSPSSKRRNSATKSAAGAFFSPVTSMAVGWGQSKGWPVSFCTGTVNPQPHRLPICFTAAEAVNPKQLENRTNAH